MEAYRLDHLLQPGEYILWQGQPNSSIRLQKSDIFMIPFSLLWCGFSVFWTVLTFQSGAPFFFPLFGLFFVAIGLYIVVGRFFTRSRRLSHTAYAVTDKRVLIAEGGSTNFMLYRQIPYLSLSLRGDGSGTIWFQPPTSYGYGKHRHHVPGIGFEEIPDAERVYRLFEGKMLEEH